MTLTDFRGQVTVINRDGADELWVTVGASDADPADPAAAGTDVWCVPASVCAAVLPLPAGVPAGVALSLKVKVTSVAAAVNYSVQSMGAPS